MSLWYTRAGLSPNIWCNSCDAIDYSPVSSVLPTPERCRKCGYGGLKPSAASVQAPKSTVSREQYDELRKAAVEANRVLAGFIGEYGGDEVDHEVLANLRGALEQSN